MFKEQCLPGVAVLNDRHAAALGSILSLVYTTAEGRCVQKRRSEICRERQPVQAHISNADFWLGMTSSLPVIREVRSQSLGSSRVDPDEEKGARTISMASA